MTVDEYAGLRFWKAVDDGTRTRTRERLTHVVDAHGDDLVATFYGAFLGHEEGRVFLKHSLVQQRLSHSMAGWLRRLAAIDPLGDLTEFVAVQMQIGAIHARMKVPDHLVHQGASLLKSRMASHLLADRGAGDDMASTLVMIDELVDFSICAMSKAYLSDARERAQVDEAFRHFSLGQDINLERETQRAALMEWSQEALFNLFGASEHDEPKKLGASAFGLWMRHRAGVLFQDSPSLAGIERVMAVVDDECLPAVAENRGDADALGRLKERIDEIDYLLNDMFQAAATLENGRDPLTRTLNRRFLPSVLGREIALAKSHGTPLSVALVDVDHFKRINDDYGHAAGDVALGHVADALMSAVRTSDFVFRYGGEEFLLVFAETDRDAAARMAERLRVTLSQKPLPVSDRDALRLTVSIGVAAFEGHPDYQYLVNNADSALYEAKRLGRDRVHVHEGAAREAALVRNFA
ncbi:MAG: GGDEF domain-containing protein [Sphingopyxis sp.]